MTAHVLFLVLLVQVLLCGNRFCILNRLLCVEGRFFYVNKIKANLI